jgi:hypothetical protein
MWTSLGETGDNLAILGIRLCIAGVANGYKVPLERRFTHRPCVCGRLIHTLIRHIFRAAAREIGLIPTIHSPY